MYEKLNEVNEFDELNEREQSEYLDKFQDDLEKEDNGKNTSNDVSFLGNTGDTKAIKDAKKYVEWAADNGFTGHHMIQAKNQLKEAQEAKEEADKLTKG